MKAFGDVLFSLVVASVPFSLAPALAAVTKMKNRIHAGKFSANLNAGIAIT